MYWSQDAVRTTNCCGHPLENVVLPVRVLDTDRLLLLLLDVTLPDANKDADQEEQAKHAGANLHDFHVADHLRHLADVRLDYLGQVCGFIRKQVYLKHVGYEDICAATTDQRQRVAVDRAISHSAAKASGTRIGRAHLHLVVAPGRVKKRMLLTIFHRVPDVGVVPWQGRRSCVTAGNCVASVP